MSYGPMPLPGDSESLQTDVMRFMAIIGFCLIAILALVKEAAPSSRASEPVAVPVAVPTSEPLSEQMKRATVKEAVSRTSPPSTAAPATDTDSNPALPTAAESTTQVLASAPSPAAQVPRWEQPLPSLIPEPANPRPTPKPRVQPREQPKPLVEQQTARANAGEIERDMARESATGLSLRFASDNDFLRLIAKGDIEVYAYHGVKQNSGTPAAPPAYDPSHRSVPSGAGILGKEILKLDGNYQFRDSPAPGRVYELLQQTIPGLVINALRTTGRDINAFTWAIVLPPHIEQQLERHLGRVSSGELVIDRYGEVQHVAAR